MKSFFSKLGSWFKKVFGSTAAWEQTASGTIKMIAPLLQEIVTLAVGEAAGAEVQAVCAEVVNDLGTAAVMIGDIQTGAAQGTTVYAKIGAALGAATSGLSGLLAAGHIKDPAKVQTVTGIVNTITGEIQAILSELPGQTAGAPAAPAKP